MKKSIRNIDLMKVGGADAGDKHYGGNQEWYSSRWRRGAGCGPTVVTGIVSYMLRSGAGREIEKPEFLEMMDDVWEFVTPTMGGLPTTGHLIERIEKYIAASGGDFSAASGFPVGVREFAVSGKPSERPGFAGAAEFIGAALDDDVPVAFLCLDDGGETALDEWHWTTLVALDAGEDSATAMIIDSGRLFEVDLYKWYHGNKKGGGFVAMTR